ncbi:MAG TPA: Mur ligase domain-containing protein, partial [Chloroflexota bacterium]
MSLPHVAGQPGPLDSATKFHFVGIGGIGMSALAQLLLDRGKVVSGSDVRSSGLTDMLAGRGVPIFIGHAAENVGRVDLVVATSAARPD